MPGSTALPVPPGLEGLDHRVQRARRRITSSPANDPFVQLFEMRPGASGFLFVQGRPDLKKWGAAPTTGPTGQQAKHRAPY
jgi:hypothetical protein